MSNTPEMRSHLERATSSLQAANLLRSAELPNDAASRAYYALIATKLTVLTLVQKCLDAKGQDITQWKTEIEVIVDRLDDLTNAERVMIVGRAIKVYSSASGLV